MSLGHHVLPVKTCMMVFSALLFLTAITVGAANIDLGWFNFPLAMIIATIKAALVVFFFMGLLYDSNENRTIFFSSFIFLAIFVMFTLSDVLFRDKSERLKEQITQEAKTP
jgi:cytochrome c oxidase subunit IV